MMKTMMERVPARNNIIVNRLFKCDKYWRNSGGWWGRRDGIGSKSVGVVKMLFGAQPFGLVRILKVNVSGVKGG